jgi:hypothetical protein
MTHNQKRELQAIIGFVFSTAEGKTISNRLKIADIKPDYNIWFGGYVECTVLVETEKAYLLDVLYLSKISNKYKTSGVQEMTKEIWIPKSHIRKMYFFKIGATYKSDFEGLFKISKFMRSKYGI